MKLQQVTHPKYPAVNFMLRHGWWVVVVISLAPVTLGVWFAAHGQSPWAAGGGMVASLVAFVLLRTFLELVQILADFVLPR